MKGKKLLAIVLCLLLTISLLPVSALADGEDPTPTDTMENGDPAADEPGEGSGEADPVDKTDEAEKADEANGGEEDAPPAEEKKEQGAPALRTVLADGYYIAGTMNGWQDFINGSNPEQYKLSLNTLAQGEEYMITLNFPANSSFKIVYVQNNAIRYWFGSNYDNYNINNSEAGWYTVYFSNWSLYNDPDGNATISAFLCYSITTISEGNGSISASHVRACAGTTITLTITPDAGYELDHLTILNLHNGYSWTQITNTFGMTDGDAKVTATFRLATAHTIAEGSSAVTHGHAVVKNAANETVTSAIEGEILHIEVDNLDSGYMAAYYSVRTQQYGGGEIVSNRPIDQTFEMPGQNAWFSVIYYPSESGYYWENRSYPVAPTSGNALNPANLMTADGAVYTAIGQVNSTNFYVCQYDANTKTVLQSWNRTVSGSGVARITFDPNAASDNITIARQHSISTNVTGNGALTVDSIAYTGDTVTITATPDAGYRLDTLLVNNGAVTVTDGSFVMPDADVTVSATFIAQGSISNGFYITSLAEPTVSDLGPENILQNRTAILPGTFSYTGDLTAGTWYLVKVFDNAVVQFEYQDEDCYIHDTTALPFTVPATETQTVYVRLSDDGVYLNTSVYNLPACTSLSGLYCWNVTIHDWKFTTITADDAFVLNSDTGWYYDETVLTNASYVCAVQLENGDFIRSYPADAFTNSQFYVASGEEFGYGTPIAAIVYFRMDGAGQAADGWQHGYLKADRKYDIFVDPVLNGAVNVYKSAGNLIGLEVVPEAGYTLGSITVKDANDDPVALTPAQSIENWYEFNMPLSHVYVTVEILEDGDYYVYTKTMYDSDQLPGAAYKLAYYLDGDFAFYRFVQKDLLVAGDQIRIVKIQNGAVAAQYPNDSYWMTLTAQNLDDETTGTEIGFRPGGFPASYTDPAAVFEDASGDRLFYKVIYGNVVIGTEHDVTVQQATGGTVTADKTSAYEGDTVTLTVTLETGYALDALTATYVDGENATQALTLTQDANDATKWTFTMPAYDVTVSVTITTEAPQTEYDAFVWKLGGILGDVQILRYTILVDKAFENPTFELTIGGEARSQVQTEDDLYLDSRACWWLASTSTAVEQYPDYTQYVILVKLFAKQYNSQAKFVIKCGEQVLRVRSYENLNGNIQGTVDTSVSYSLVDLMDLYAALNYQGKAAKWAALSAAMADFATKLNAVI